MWSTVLPCLDKDYKNQVIIIIMLYFSIFMSKLRFKLPLKNMREMNDPV